MARLKDSARHGREHEMATYLCRETGVTEQEAWLLIRDLGMELNSLLREARELVRVRTPKNNPKDGKI